MAESEEDFEENASFNSDTDDDSIPEVVQEEDDEYHPSEIEDEEEMEIEELSEDDDEKKLIRAEKRKIEKRKRKEKIGKGKEGKQPKIKFSKKAVGICSVPGCRSKFLVNLGVKLTSFQVPQPNNSCYSKVWLKWVHALGYSTSEEASKVCNLWARICELHFTEDCFAKSYEPNIIGKKYRSQKRLTPGSYPTLNIPVPERVLEDPRLVFQLDPIIGEQNPLANIASSSNTEMTEAEKSKLKAKILKEADSMIEKELNQSKANTVIPQSLLDRRRDEYDKKVRKLILESGIEGPPSFIDDLMNKLGVERMPEPPPAPVPPSSLPPCTILRPVAKEGEPPLPAILLPGLDNVRAIKLLEDPNIQELLKKMAEKHKDDMAKKMAEEDAEDGEGDIEELNEETGEVVRKKKTRTIPPPPMIILQATDPKTKQKPNPGVPDIVQQAIDRTFNEQPQRMLPPPTPRAKIEPTTQKPVRWQHQKFLNSLPPIESKLVLSDNGEIVSAPTADHDYGQASHNSGIPIFDPTGLRQEIEQWRMEVEMLRRKNYELKIRLNEGRYSLKMGNTSIRSKNRGTTVERRRVDKLEATNRKLQEELVKLKLERRRMMNKERNRKRKRRKVLERRQKRRDWIMHQIELGNMTKEHLELVYSRKKLPYEKKGGNPLDPISLYTIPVATQLPTIATQEDNVARPSPAMKRRAKQLAAGRSQQNVDMSIQSVVVTTGDMQTQELNDENVVAVSGIPGVVITSGTINGATHEFIVQGTSDEYTHEQIDFIVKAVDDMQASGWKVNSPRTFQRQHY